MDRAAPRTRGASIDAPDRDHPGHGALTPPEALPPWPAALAAWRWLEQAFDRAFGSAGNPLRQLGTLGFLAFWLLALSGLWLYAVLDTSAGGAYASIQALSRGAAGVLRSLHRYAADALVLFTALHLLREALHGRWRGFRGFTWWTGTAVLPLLAVAAVGGFWLNWDRLGQFSAIATAEWLDALPLLAQPLARNFAATAAVGDRLFSLFVFVHLGVPLLLLFGLWFHLQRLAHAAVFPPRRLATGTLAALLGLALAAPVAGQGPADLASVPAQLALDWWVLAAHPLMYATSAGTVWLLLGGAWAALLALPWLPPRRRSAAAVVDARHCSGCARCVADCPYAAVTLVPHPQRPGRALAQVDADLCAACGLCAGACPSSTPARRAVPLVTGIDLPQQPVDALRRALHEGLRRAAAPDPLVLWHCAQGAAPAPAPDVVALPLVCTGLLPPAFIDHALRAGAAGVVVASCRGCGFRLGARWTAERLAGRREPRLRAAAPRQRVLLLQADPGETAALQAGVAVLRARLNQIKAAGDAGSKMPHG